MHGLVRSPRLDALRRAAHDLYRSRPDLQAEFPDRDGPDYWFWLMWHGAAESEALRAALYPFPDRRLQDRVIGRADDELFHRGGLVDWRRMDSCLRAAGYSFAREGSLLDFGCGSARLLRFFGLYAGTTSFTGADVDPEAIEWCRRTIDFASFSLLSLDPPTPFADGAFTAVISYSVFSHLSEERHLAWLQELRRITAPGAVVVLTTQGMKVMQLISNGERDGVFPGRAVLTPAVSGIVSRGFGFFPYRHLEPADPQAANPFKSWDLESYGAAFVLDPYVRKNWTRWFDLVDHAPAPDGWQDYVVLRRPM